MTCEKMEKQDGRAFSTDDGARLLLISPLGQPLLPVCPLVITKALIMMSMMSVFRLHWVKHTVKNVQSSIPSNVIESSLRQDLAEYSELKVRNTRDRKMGDGLLDADREGVVLESSREGEREVLLDITLQHAELVLLLGVDWDDPFGVNDVVGYDVEGEKLPQCLLAEWREQVEDETLG